MEAVISTLIWAAIIQGVLLACLYLFSRKHRSLANRLLGFFLLVIVYEATIEFLPFNNAFGYSLGYYFSFPEVKLFYPVLFFHYILEKVGRTKDYTKVLRFHYVLAFLVAGIALINILLFLWTGNKMEYFLGYPRTEAIFMAHQYYAFLLIVLVFILSIIELKRCKGIVVENYSDYALLNINWLWKFIFIMLPIILLWGAELVRIIIGGRGGSDFVVAIWGAVVIAIYFVSYQAFRHKNLFEDMPEDPDQTKGKQTPTMSPSMLENEEDQKLIQRIHHYMETEEPYLDASLSMYQLARQLKIPPRDLSQFINHKLDKHFFDFVNEYRIKKATHLLSDPANRKMTVLEILYEVGFNSKSSFNTVFKKYTGQTPTQYRKSRLLSAT